MTGQTAQLSSAWQGYAVRSGAACDPNARSGLRSQWHAVPTPAAVPRGWPAAVSEARAPLPTTRSGTACNPHTARSGVACSGLKARSGLACCGAKTCWGVACGPTARPGVACGPTARSGVERGHHMLRLLLESQVR